MTNILTVDDDLSFAKFHNSHQGDHKSRLRER
jgi:hypothetical protein